MNPGQEHPPCLYLLWQGEGNSVSEVPVPPGYLLRSSRPDDGRAWLELHAAAGEPVAEEHWHSYRDALLPKGLFIVEYAAPGQVVATAGAVHNPNPGRYYFPFGGELGYVVVRPDHRRRGLGRVVCAAAVGRLLSAGYDSIRVCVQEHRLPALRTYLGLGFEPFLHSPEVEGRWQRVCAQLQVPFMPERWPTHV